MRVAGRCTKSRWHRTEEAAGPEVAYHEHGRSISHFPCSVTTDRLPIRSRYTGRRAQSHLCRRPPAASSAIPAASHFGSSHGACLGRGPQRRMTRHSAGGQSGRGG